MLNSKSRALSVLIAIVLLASVSSAAAAPAAVPVAPASARAGTGAAQARPEAGATGAAKAALAKLSFDVQPTFFFIEEKGVLKQRLDILLENPGVAAAGQLQIGLSMKPLIVPVEKIAAGKSVVQVFVPEITRAAKVEFVLKVGKVTATRTVALAPQRKWTLFLMPHSHTDIGYTELQSRVLKNHLEYIDAVIDFCKATESYPEEARFRWNIEASWAFENYLRSRPADKVQQLLALLQSGRVELSANYLNMSDGFAHEELIRASIYSKVIGRTLGFPVQAAMNNDVTGFSWALPQIFSQMGVKYFTTGINEDRARAPLRRPNPFYWQSADGSKILHWNGEHYLFSNYDLQLHEAYEKSFPKVTDYLARLEKRGDYPYDLIGFHISGYVTDNCPPKKELSDRVREWNSHWAFPKLRLATMSEFFGALEKKFAKAIPTYKLGWPDYWTDGVGSTAFETGLNRLAHSDILTAEKMAVAAKLTDKAFAFPAAEIRDAYESATLYDEHTWGAWNSISDPDSEFARSQWAYKSGFAYGAREIAKTVLERSLPVLLKSIASPDARAIAVFNPLSWERTDVVRVALPADLQAKDVKFKLFDKRSGFEIATQRPDKSTLMFLAAGVPAFGYAVYTLTPDMAPMNFAPMPKAAGNVLESRYYRVTADPITGGLSSVIDKETGRELVDARAKVALNQYIYENPVGGRDAVNNMAKPAEFNRYSPVAAAAAGGLAGPVASSLVIRSKAKPCPDIEQEIVLYDGLKRIDIVNRLKKDETREAEALYFAFPFGVEAGKWRFEIADGTMAPETEQLPGTTRDWQAVQNWVEIAGPKQTVVWSPVEAPLVEFGGINTGKWLKKLPLTNTSVYSYAMNNYWHTNFKAGQGGPFVFRYSITTRPGGADLVGSTRFGWEVHTPLLASWLPAKNAGPLPAAGASLFSVDKPNVIIQAVKAAEDGNGFVIRLREIAGTETTVKITCPLLKSDTVTYTATDVAEGPANARTVVPGSIYVILKPLAIQTVIIRDYQ
jgi:alpha-mannosidase